MTERTLFSLRLPPDLRARLEKEVKKSHHSLTVEILARLEQTLTEGHLDDAKPLAPRSATYLKADTNVEEVQARYPKTESGGDPLEAELLRRFRDLPADKQVLVLAILKLVA